MSGDGSSPINWAGLLKWSLKYSDNTLPTSQLSEEDVTFLQNAIKEALANAEDPNEVVNDASEKLSDPSAAVVLTALDVIERCVDLYPELPRNFYQLIAIQPLLDVLHRNDETLCSKTLSILTSVLSNNPQVQDFVLQQNGLNRLLEFLNMSESMSVSAKCIGTIAALIRENKTGETAFLDNDGLSFIVKGLKSNHQRFQERTMNLCKHLIQSNRMKFGQIVDYELVEAILFVLQNNSLEDTGIQFGEACAQLVEAVVQMHRYNLHRRGELSKLQAAVIQRLEYLETFNNNEEWDVEEEKELCRSIIMKATL